MGWPQGHQVIIEAEQDIIGSAARSNLNTQFSNINKSFDSPCRLSAAYPTADAKLYIQPNEIEMGNLTGISIFPIQKSVVTVAASTIDFQTQATSGATFVVSWPSSTIGQFRRAGLSLLANGSINVSFSAEVAVEGTLANPGTLFIDGAIPLGWVDLECTNVAGYFKTIGSASNIIENKTSAIRIHNFSGAIVSHSTEKAQQDIAASGTISLNSIDNQVIPVAGAAGAQTASNTPFGATPPRGGARVSLVGTHDTNTLTLTYNDVANGCLLNGSAVLKKGFFLDLIYVSALSRYIEVSRNF